MKKLTQISLSLLFTKTVVSTFELQSYFHAVGVGYKINFAFLFHNLTKA